MKRSPLRRRSSLTPGAAPRRKTPVRKRNPERAKKRHAETFGAKANWIRRQPCAVPDCCYACTGMPIEAAHARSRGAGGKAASLVPLCHRHHSWQHEFGVRTFGAMYGVDLAALAAEYKRRWREVRDAR